MNIVFKLNEIRLLLIPLWLWALATLALAFHQKLDLQIVYPIILLLAASYRIPTNDWDKKFILYSTRIILLAGLAPAAFSEQIFKALESFGF